MKGPLLGYSPKDLYKSLRGNWRDMPTQYGLPSNSQVFARFLKQAGFEGVIYPSAQGDGDCIALFLDQLDGSDSYLELADKPPSEVSIIRLDSDTAVASY